MRLQVTIAETGITSPGQSRRIKGEGMPVHNFPSDRGDLVVRYKLKMPGSLTDEQRQLLEQVRTLRLISHCVMLRSDGCGFGRSCSWRLILLIMAYAQKPASSCAKSDSPTVLACTRPWRSGFADRGRWRAFCAQAL